MRVRAFVLLLVGLLAAVVVPAYAQTDLIGASATLLVSIAALLVAVGALIVFIRLARVIERWEERFKD